MDSLQRAIDAAGGLSALAGRLKVSPQVVANWRRRKSVPAGRALEIERATEGLVKAEAIRPDLYPKDRH